MKCIQGDGILHSSHPKLISVGFSEACSLQPWEDHSSDSWILPQPSFRSVESPHPWSLALLIRPSQLHKGQNSLSSYFEVHSSLRLPIKFLVSCLKCISGVSLILRQRRLWRSEFGEWRELSCGRTPTPLLLPLGFFGKEQVRRVSTCQRFTNTKTQSSSRDIKMEICRK